MGMGSGQIPCKAEVGLCMLSGLLESETLPHGSRPHNGVGPEFPSLTTAKCGILVGKRQDA